MQFDCNESLINGKYMLVMNDILRRMMFSLMGISEKLLASPSPNIGSCSQYSSLLLIIANLFYMSTCTAGDLHMYLADVSHFTTTVKIP